MHNSLQTYKDKYEKGYGLAYPDGHIIRFYERILKYKLGITSGNMLDFGCGNGIHSAYFKSKGFKPFGIDIVPNVKTLWEKNVSQWGGESGKCHIIEPNSSFKTLFNEKMQVILANQSLYYLTQHAFSQTISELYELSNKGGILFATMMSEKNYYFALSDADEGYMKKVSIKARLCEESFIHFIKEAKELISLFKPFETLYLGEYDLFHLYDFEGSAHHYIYIGIKK